MPLRLTVSVSGLKPLVSYRLYRYSSLGAVPNSGFNAAAAKATAATPTVKATAMAATAIAGNTGRRHKQSQQQH